MVPAALGLHAAPYIASARRQGAQPKTLASLHKTIDLARYQTCIAVKGRLARTKKPLAGLTRGVMTQLHDLSVGIPYEIRTRVAAVKGRCPRPLDERDIKPTADV